VHDDGYFDERVAARYDDDAAELFAPEVLGPVIDFLAELAGDGRALELGVETGRIALPLAQRGVQVHGIDLSEAMGYEVACEAWRRRHRRDDRGFATTTVDGSFSLAYLAFQTIMNLTTQEAQVACFRNVSAPLQPGGRFAIDAMIPELQWLPPRRDRTRLHLERGPLGVRRVRRRGARTHLASLLDATERSIASPSPSATCGLRNST